MCYLGGQQRVGVEALHVGHQVVLGVDDVLDKHAVEQEPVGAAVHRDAFRDFAIAQPPHVGVALEEEAIQALLADEPGQEEKNRAASASSWTLCCVSEDNTLHQRQKHCIDCTVLHCTVSHCMVAYCIVKYRTLSSVSVLFHSILFSIPTHCMVLCCILSYYLAYPLAFHITPYRIVLCHIVVYHIISDHIVL